MMITDAELTILNLVAEGARYGHEIQELIEKRGLREWVTIGFSSVHYLLNNLEEQNMLGSELRSDGRLPARKIYHITEAGKGVLQTAIADRLRQPRAFGTGFELALANLTVLKPQQVYKILTQHHSDLRNRLLAIEHSWQKQQNNNETIPEHIEALYTHSIALMQAELGWLKDFLEKWGARYPAVQRGMFPEENTVPPKADTRHYVQETKEPEKRLQKIKRPKPDEAGETPTAIMPPIPNNIPSDETPPPDEAD